MVAHQAQYYNKLKQIPSDTKVAIIHYWFMSWRGGEKVVASLCELFPQADIYCLFADTSIKEKYLPKHKVYSSFLDKPGIKKKYKNLFFLYPYAIKKLRLRKKYDLIISSESGPAKGITIPLRTPHICYIHTPMRYCWGKRDDYLQVLPSLLRPVVNASFERLRRWDESTIDQVDLYVANSQNVAKRVLKYYHRQAQVCYPPVSLEGFDLTLEEKEDFYLSFGALTPYKNVDLLVDTFNENGKKLYVIGEGSEKKKLQKKAKSNIVFLGYLEDTKVVPYLQKAKALLFPAEEDLGLVVLEAMKQGTPIVALGAGGALETVIENKENIEKSTGCFFLEPNKESLQSTLDYFETICHTFNSLFIRTHARKFGDDFFKSHFLDQVIQVLS